MKVAWDDSAVKLACCDYCGLPLNASERIPEQALFTRREADVISEAIFTMMTGDRDDELAAMDLSMIAVALTPS